ncbi:hypothetical protein HMPREF9371_0076 [Neisseria shayeganii 871]|uniref:Uncharacterized protein n=1 Tax=Neisseria shayeganii 871 TaxID=1032488 RepID=G4CEN7_9NEIS|nr:hypothetical protein HMPREF9371_0076 [Neisseria shayeganii 871]
MAGVGRSPFQVARFSRAVRTLLSRSRYLSGLCRRENKQDGFR